LDLLISPRPALTIVLEHNPDEVMLASIIDDDLCKAFAFRGDYGQSWVKL
jgi:hypothetical protein